MLIVALGDSVTRGVREGVAEAQIYAARLAAALQAAGRDAEVIASGMPAENTEGALQRLPEVLVLQPQFVTVMYGLNDAIASQTFAVRTDAVPYSERATQLNGAA
ncbi:MAG TPA: SGNH/GDSL hydrolase family protein, partial [Abditibacteriaceae bacterium]|nr:SGNH/GDSL hydrolase family protein [Abditibacteriaceae bacterium]